MTDCIFCKIIKGELNSVKIWEDNEFLAILDRKPNTEAMTLLLTKEHYDSYILNMPDEIYQKFMLAAKTVSKILEKGLNVKRVAIVIEGMNKNHAHIKLYPLHGLKDTFKEMRAKDKIYFKEYKGYISTQLGPKKSIEELKEIANKIRNNQRSS